MRVLADMISAVHLRKGLHTNYEVQHYGVDYIIPRYIHIIGSIVYA